jgi:hypothetical protein
VNSALVHKVYGRFLPRSEERDRWEMKAAEMDAQTGITLASSEALVTAQHAASAPARPFRQPTKIDWPSVPELLVMLETASAVAVASRLGVSEAALRKRLKRHGVTKKPDGRRKSVSGRPALRLVPDEMAVVSRRSSADGRRQA